MLHQKKPYVFLRLIKKNLQIRTFSSMHVQFMAAKFHQLARR